MKRKRTKKEAPDPIDIYVGSRVRARRMGLRISQSKLGDAIDLTFQQIQKYENGSNRIGASNLYKIAQHLGVEVAFFFEGIENAISKISGKTPKGLADKAQAAFKNDPMNTRETIDLMYNYYRITDPNVRKTLFQFVKSLAITDK